jgi:hypothetical protein
MLFGFFMGGVLAAKWAIFFIFDPARMFGFVFSRGVIAILTFPAF